MTLRVIVFAVVMLAVVMLAVVARPARADPAGRAPTHPAGGSPVVATQPLQHATQWLIDTTEHQSAAARGSRLHASS